MMEDTVTHKLEQHHCHSCGNVSSATITIQMTLCPHCGAPQQLINYTKRKKTTLALLTLFLGGMGIHKFYLQNISMGLLYLFTAWTMIPTIIAVIEAIRMFNMDTHAFDNKYNC